MGKPLSNKEKFFEKEARRFVKYFSLDHWEVSFREIESKNARAQCAVWDKDDNTINSLMAVIEYDKNWVNLEDTDYDEISAVAFHEVMELLLIPLRDFLNNPDNRITWREIDTEAHRIINTLSNTIYKDFLKPGFKEEKVATKKKKTTGFKNVQKEISEKQGVSMERAGAILASQTRKASKKPSKRILI